MARPNGGTRDKNRSYEELRLLYQVTVSDIATFKEQQWKITNYGLLLFAAIVSLPKLLPDTVRFGACEIAVLIILAFLILVAGWFLLYKFYSSLYTRWCRLTEIRKKFTGEFKNAWRCGKPENEMPDNPETKESLLWFFCIVLLGGFCITSWILLKSVCAI